ncbi:MAG TPA: dephospho-CoA kinase, partial [Thermoanaerobaculia bacterium]|nr:dephospho-CoA kinase [Thermoanaerobaculia bacterium]
GGLASGKSTVAGWLRDAGFLVVDADRLVAELHQPGGSGAAAVRDLFGPEYLNEQGGVDHAKVGALVFADPASRHALEKAVHPLVRQRFAELAEQTDEVAVLEATLLVEAGHTADFDLVVTVECDAETRLRRATARGLSEETARARLLAQGDGEQRRRAAHRRIDNCDDLQHLRRQVDDLIEELRRLARD